MFAEFTSSINSLPQEAVQMFIILADH